jgi:replicative DNA helicase
MPTNEANVISAVARNKDIHLILSEDRELFGAYGDIFDFIKAEYLKNKYIPEPALIEQRFSEVDIPDTTAPTAYYLEELRNSFIENRMETILTKAATALGNELRGPQVLEKLQESLAKLGKYTNSARDLNLMDGEDALAHFEKLRSQSDDNGGTPGIATGWKSIDSAYPTGMAGGHSIVVMGYTGRGKSMWADALAHQAWKQGKHVMIISLEMSPEEQRERVYAMMSDGQFKISDLSRGDVAEDDFREFSRRKLSKGAKFTIVSSQGVTDVTPNLIQAKIDSHRPDLVILDYLQLMKDNAKTQQMTPRMLNLSREIKMLAVANNIPVVSITAVTDEDGDKRDAPPVLSQISWSSGIEYDANLAIAVHRHDDTDVVEVVCRKNRHGSLFDFGFEVDFNAGLWEEKFDLF